MKHNLKTIFILITFFLIAQFLGLAILAQYIDIKQTATTQETVINEQSYNITGIQPSEIRDDSYSFIFITIAVLLGTGIVLLIVKFKKRNLWKAWFYLSVIISLMMAFSPFMEKFLKLFQIAQYTFYITLVIVAILGYFKVFKPNLYVHNFTELFIYGGLAAILVPVLNITSIVILLILISIYDAYAVWKSKHMIAMAEFQTEQNLFAGLMVHKKAEQPEKENQEKTAKETPILVEQKITANKEQKNKTKTTETTIPTNEKQATESETQSQRSRTAILGGGDIAFPLLFAGTVFKYAGSLLQPIVIIITTAIALFLLFLYGKKSKYYPAMPFLTAGCFIGYGLLWLFHLI